MGLSITLTALSYIAIGFHVYSTVEAEDQYPSSTMVGGSHKHKFAKSMWRRWWRKIRQSSRCLSTKARLRVVKTALRIKNRMYKSLLRRYIKLIGRKWYHVSKRIG